MADGAWLPGMASTLHRVRWDLRFRAAQHRWYLSLARRRYGDAVVGDSTELVIDGFTRTAVTFSVIAFQVAQRRPVRLAHTIHSAAHVADAARRRVPCLVAIREPDDTVLSIAIREPDVTLSTALGAYARFCDLVARELDHVVVADFTEITTDFGPVIDRLNAKFATSFDRFEHDREHVDTVFEIIEDRSRRPAWSEALGDFEDGRIGLDEYRREKARCLAAGLEPTLAVPEHRVQRPSGSRTVRKEEMRAELHASGLRTRRRHAHDAYRRLMTS
ncbi:MAG: hypothetical protein ACRDGK_09930 [Actinomycetota bacterium]